MTTYPYIVRYRVARGFRFLTLWLLGANATDEYVIEKAEEQLRKDFDLDLLEPLPNHIGDFEVVRRLSTS